MYGDTHVSSAKQLQASICTAKVKLGNRVLATLRRFRLAHNLARLVEMFMIVQFVLVFWFGQ